MIKDNNMRKIFVKEALGKKNYISYRTDLMLYKIILSIIIFLIIYLMTVDFILAILISIQVFVIFSLINKLNISHKNKEGEEKLVSRIKKEYFQKKLNEINVADFEMLVGYLLEKEGWKNFIKKGRHMYLAENCGIIYCIKIFKLFEEIEVEKLDVRSMVTYMCQNNIRMGCLVITGGLSENAQELLDKFQNKLEINIVDLDGLLELMEKNKILPEDKYFYNKICEGKSSVENKAVVKNNIFDNKKTFVYVLAAIFFYASSIILPDNSISKYLYYYFIILTAISVVYSRWFKKYENDTKVK